jgi:hypothetical protein
VSRPGGNGDQSDDLPVGASAAKRPPLRRGLLGYKRNDVHQALDARDAELTELRQDVAALWLAFGQHDRMIRTALEQGAASRPAAPPRPPQSPAPASTSPAPPANLPESEAEPIPTASITRQLSELDDVLAAIETATQSLERNYAHEIAPDENATPSQEAVPEDAPPTREDR